MGKGPADTRTPDHAKRRTNHAAIYWGKDPETRPIDVVDIAFVEDPHFRPHCHAVPNQWPLMRHAERGWKCNLCGHFRAYPSEARQRKIERTILNG